MIGLVTLLFIMIVFVAESMRAATHYDERRVFLRIGQIWPFMVVNLLLLAALVWCKELRWATPIVFAAAAGWSIYIFGTIVRTLLDPALMDKYRRQLVADRLKRLMIDSVRNQLGNVILSEPLVPGQVHGLTPYKPRNVDYINIGCGKGRLKDVNLGELRRLLEYLEKRAQAHSFSLFRTEQQYRDMQTEERSALSRESEPVTAYKPIVFSRRFGENLRPDGANMRSDDAVIAIPAEFREQSVLIAEIESRIQKIFRFSDSPALSTKFRREMRVMQERILSAIRNSLSASVEGDTELYIQLATSFLKTLNEYGAGYSHEAATKERTSAYAPLRTPWSEVKWIVDDIRTYLEEAVKHGSVDVLGHVSYLPYKILSMSVQAREHLLFQEFIGFPVMLYAHARTMEDRTKAGFLSEFAWQRLEGLVLMDIRPLIESTEDEEELRNHFGFVIEVFKAYQQLLKTAHDNLDKDYFHEVVESFFSLFDFLKGGDKIIEEIDALRMEVVFGLAAKILDDCAEQKRTETAPAVAMLKELFGRLPQTIDEIARTYARAHKYETSKKRGWFWWEMEGKRGVQFGGFDLKLRRLFCILALYRLEAHTVSEPPHISVESDLASSRLETADDSSLLKELREIAENSEKWGFILKEDKVVEGAKLLEESLKRMYDDLRHKTESDLIEAPLDQDLVEKFKKEAKEAYDESATIVGMLQLAGAYDDQTKSAPPVGLQSWGLHQLDEKAAIVRDWPVDYPRWGGNYGESLAKSLNEALFEQLCDKATRTEIDTRSAFITTLQGQAEAITKPVLITTHDPYALWGRVPRYEAFIERYRKECPETPYANLHGYQGVLRIADKIIPVLRLYPRSDELKRHVLLFDPREYCVFKQYCPADSEEETSDFDKRFFFRITDLSAQEGESIRKKLLAGSPLPPWLEEIEEEKRETHLKQNVVVEFYMRFELEVKVKGRDSAALFVLSDAWKA